MFVKAGARRTLLQQERQKFLADEWPRIEQRIERLGLKAEELLRGGRGAPADTARRTGDAAEEEH
jgi:GntR family transcriptional regulator